MIIKLFGSNQKKSQRIKTASNGLDQLMKIFHMKLEGDIMTLAEQIKEEGRYEGKLEVAKQLLENGADLKLVARATQLPLLKIEDLQKNN